MVIKVYISGISGNKEVKKRQQRVSMILDSRNIKYVVVDIAEPGNEEEKDYMQNHSTSLGATVGDANPRHPLPPQLFNDSTYCGDYDLFDMSNEIDELEKFLKLAPDDSAPTVTSSAEITFDSGEVVSSEETEKNLAEDAEETNEAQPAKETNEAEAANVEDEEESPVVNGGAEEDENEEADE